MSTTMIVSLILALAPVYNIDPKVALSVAIVESSLNPNAVGGAGEIGLYQIMPDIAKKKGFTAKQLKNPTVNITVGLEMLEDAKKHCVHKRNLDFLVCYNYGQKNARLVKHPSLFPYVKRVAEQLKKQQSLQLWVR